MYIKLDISKIYDRVEWPFLEAIKYRLGFSESWINMIMLCVRSVSYSIKINEEPKGFINSIRGLRQGKPVSPYLFLLCTDGLTSLLTYAA